MRWDATQAVPFVDGGWGTVVADPPWLFHNDTIPMPFPMLSTPELLDVPLGAVVAPQAHLYLWTTSAHLVDGSALKIARAWGFEPHSTIVWVKSRSPAALRAELDRVLARARRVIGQLRPMSLLPAELGAVERELADVGHLVSRIGRVQIGLGTIVRHAHELVLVGVRGGLTAPKAARRWPSVIMAPRRSHSRKPEELQDMAEALSPGPRLELFARRPRAGWTCAGNEMED